MISSKPNTQLKKTPRKKPNTGKLPTPLEMFSININVELE